MRGGRGSGSFRRGSGARALVLGIAAAGAAGAAGFVAARVLGERPARLVPVEASEREPIHPIASPAAPGRTAAAVPAEPADAASREWVETNNRARELLERGELAEAVRLFALCREARPDDPTYRHNLAEARFRLATELHEGGELARALEELELAVADAPERAELADLLARWRREQTLAENDTFAPGSYFRVEYDGAREDLVRHVQEVLDFLEGGGRYPSGAYEDLRGFFRADPVIDGAEKIRVVLYDKKEFDHLTGLGDWAGGVFDGTIRIAIDDLDLERRRWERILRHELVHAFVREVGGSDVPGWLNEGLAQLLETDPPEVGPARERLRAAEPFPLERLRESLATWTDPAEIETAYAQSLALVDFLRKNTGDAGLLELLAACREGRPADAIRGVPLEAYLDDLKRDVGR